MTNEAPAVPAVLLSARDISMRFGNLWALRDVSVDLPAGTTVGLIGPNGAGKSTLLNAIAGVIPPTDGQVLFNGSNLSRVGPAGRAHRGISRTFQDLRLFDDMTVLENVQVARSASRRRGKSSLLRRTRTERRWIIGLLESLGIADIAHTDVRLLPHPVRRLVSYARAVAGEPTCLLLDEPAAGLSDSERDVLATRLQTDIRNRGLSVLLVEHDMGFIRRLCDKAYVLNAGRVIAFGTFEEISNDQTVRAAYLGDVPVG